VDHKNNNRLDNRIKSNLRFCSAAQNAQNKEKAADCSSKYKGVSFSSNCLSRPWNVKVRRKHVGHYFEELWAAYAYDIAAKEIWGEEARINNIPKPDNFVLANPPSKDQVRVDACGNALPKGICYNAKLKTYKIRMRIEGVRNALTARSFVEATTQLQKLIQIDKQLKLAWANRPILRNDNKIAVIQLKGKHGEGKFTEVDDDKWHMLMESSWYLDKDGYAHSSSSECMHRKIIGAQPGELVDHIDNNRLNNQANNLRIASASQNSQNKRKSPDTANKYIGVYKQKSGKYQVTISYQNKIYLGQYEDEKIAAWVYNQKALELHGKHAQMNDVETPVGWAFKENRGILLNETNREMFELKVEDGEESEMLSPNAKKRRLEALLNEQEYKSEYDDDEESEECTEEIPEPDIVPYFLVV
jgi:hypothetical protein